MSTSTQHVSWEWDSSGLVSLNCLQGTLKNTENTCSPLSCCQKSYQSRQEMYSSPHFPLTWTYLTKSPRHHHRWKKSDTDWNPGSGHESRGCTMTSFSVQIDVQAAASITLNKIMRISIPNLPGAYLSLFSLNLPDRRLQLVWKQPGDILPWSLLAVLNQTDTNWTPLDRLSQSRQHSHWLRTIPSSVKAQKWHPRIQVPSQPRFLSMLFFINSNERFLR